MINDARTEPQKRQRLESDGSLAKLQPLKLRIAETDELIDQIVYKLYWLETEVGAKVEDLTPKTNVQEYYNLRQSELPAILQKNKRKLKDYDPAASSR